MTFPNVKSDEHTCPAGFDALRSKCPDFGAGLSNPGTHLPSWSSRRDFCSPARCMPRPLPYPPSAPALEAPKHYRRHRRVKQKSKSTTETAGTLAIRDTGPGNYSDDQTQSLALYTMTL